MYLGSNRSGALPALPALAALAALAVALSGCAGSDYEPSKWFSKPLNVSGRNLGYTYSQLDETKQERHITANDLVDANGACPTPAPSAQTQSAPGSPGGSPAASPEATSQLGGGVGIGMSECDVVARVGPPNAVNLGRSPNGDRTAVLTLNSGPRPGVYRFVAGRLKEMDRVEAPPPPPPPEPVKKKSAKSKKPPKKDDNS